MEFELTWTSLQLTNGKNEIREIPDLEALIALAEHEASPLIVQPPAAHRSRPLIEVYDDFRE